MTPLQPLSVTQYWMPDHLCKVCYDCATSFTLFRRRHHCRLCGQIFCYECSDHFVDPVPHGFTPENGLIRICNFCFRYIHAKNTTNFLDTNAADDKGRRSIVEDPEERSEISWSGTEEPARKSCVAPAVDPESAMYPRLPSPISESDDTTQEEVTGLYVSPQKDIHVTSEPVSPQADPADISKISSFSNRSEARGRDMIRRGNGRRSSTELLNALERNSSIMAEESDAFSINAFRSWSEKLHREKLDLGNAHMHYAHRRIRLNLETLFDNSDRALLNDHQIDKAEVISMLSAATFFALEHIISSLKHRNSNGSNYDNLIKVKCIPSTTSEPHSKSIWRMNAYSLQWYAGTVCRKHLCHKQMARELQNPRILLLAGGISYDRTFSTGRLTSLDTLLEQERSYMSILVGKISALRPDLIFVGRTVSRVAQEMLRDRGIAVVLNVKRSILERIARHTNARVLSSTDHVDQADPNHVIGTCKSFIARTVTPSLSTTSRTLGDTGAGCAQRGRVETYLYLDGCHPHNGCTITVSGPERIMLEMLKRSLYHILRVSYAILLEAKTLSDLYIHPEFVEQLKLSGRKGQTVACTCCHLRVNDDGNGKQPKYVQCMFAREMKLQIGDAGDLTLGNFILQEINGLDKRCPNNRCAYSMADHIKSFTAGTRTLAVSFEQVPDANASSLPSADSGKMNSSHKVGGETNLLQEADENAPPVSFWRWCQECDSLITPVTLLTSSLLYKYSLARFLMICFMKSGGAKVWMSDQLDYSQCPHTCEQHVMFFSTGRWVLRWDVWRRELLELGGLYNRPSVEQKIVDVDHVTWKLKRMYDGLIEQRQNLESALAELKTELESKVKNLSGFIDSLNDNEAIRAQCMLEMVCMHKIVHIDQMLFQDRIDGIFCDEKLLSWPLVRRLRKAYNIVKVDLYKSACRECYAFVQIQKMIKYHTSALCTSSSFSSSSFPAKFGAFLELMQAQALILRSPLVSPREGLDKFNSIAASTSDLFNEPSILPAVHSELIVENERTFMIENPLPTEILYEELNLATLTPSTVKLEVAANLSLKNTTGWGSRVFDMHRIIGDYENDRDLRIDLPAILLEGHTSLILQNQPAEYIFVDENIPITFVALVLSSKSYEEALDGWKLSIHHENTITFGENAVDEDSNSISSNWIQSAFASSKAANVFRYVMEETPIHSYVMKHILPPHQVITSTFSAWEFSCTTFFPLQFHILRDLLCKSHEDYVSSIAHVDEWDTTGGKSGASFFRSMDHRYVIKHITATEFQSFLEVAPLYFGYFGTLYCDRKSSFLAKILGLYQTSFVNKVVGHRMTQHIIVMENVIDDDTVTQLYDLKGSTRNRYSTKCDQPSDTAAASMESSDTTSTSDLQVLSAHYSVLMDGNLSEYTGGHPLGMIEEDYEVWWQSVQSDVMFLASVNVIDYSMLLGFSACKENTQTCRIVVGIIDYLRQFDLIKRMESVGKSVSMITGQASPTIIEPTQYAKRFLEAMQRYVMPVPLHAFRLGEKE
uniref:1-phosphatidylinositol-3-phosphate 5-kinase n=1 Tax=Albugo laibachii Nc14 TaxID=890382 RepID=F0W3N3_9STRA|nr:phosphatidylinositol3phosphate 5kinase putative [Albugo laibachii Nc14]CCA16260.1 phosphatidylinositol3phosphate 5kinase putative [Albugo laibachii Nc14]|eukprot:CCA16260.1 phosphatidylinositol3phosphate 5kinase putative [Albugo laibachii Nc14]